MSLFTTAETLPFGIAFALIVAIALIEGLGMLVSLSPSNLLDHLLPDIDGDTGLDRVLGWMHLGKVPSLVLLVLFLAGYALFGYGLQMVAHGLLGSYLPGWVAALASNCMTQTATHQSLCNRAVNTTISSARITCSATIVHRGTFGPSIP